MTKAKKDQHKTRRANGGDIELGKLIRLRRIELKMSQAELGGMLGVSFQQQQKYEKGVNRVGAVRLQEIAAALKTPLSFFQPDEGVKGANSEVQSLLFVDPSTCLPLLRAFVKLDKDVRHRFVGLVEAVSK